MPVRYLDLNTIELLKVDTSSRPRKSASTRQLIHVLLGVWIRVLQYTLRGLTDNMYQVGDVRRLFVQVILIHVTETGSEHHQFIDSYLYLNR